MIGYQWGYAANNSKQFNPNYHGEKKHIINATVEKETTNKYYISVIVEDMELIKENVVPTSIVGVDLGIKDLVVTSDGEKYSNHKEI